MAIISILHFEIQQRKDLTSPYKTIILFAVLYGYKTWSLILREGHRLRVLRIPGPRGDEIVSD
jgi:hypothetical protein